MFITNPTNQDKYYFDWNNDACRLTIIVGTIEPIHNTPLLVYLCPHPDKLTDWEIEQADKCCGNIWREYLPSEDDLRDWDL
jgi:hypothetical protein